MKANTFLDLFMYQVAEHGAKPAVIDPETGRQMTYAELDEYAGRAAAKMRENGVKHGDCIALVMPGCLDEVAAMLAAMKAGASFTMSVSMNPGATAFTVMLRLASSSARAFVASMSPALDAE